MCIKEIHNRTKPKGTYQRSKSHDSTCQETDQRTDRIIGDSVPEISNLRPFHCHNQRETVIRCNPYIRRLIQRNTKAADNHPCTDCKHSLPHKLRNPDHTHKQVVEKCSDIPQQHCIYHSSRSNKFFSEKKFHNKQQQIHQYKKICIRNPRTVG